MRQPNRKTIRPACLLLALSALAAAETIGVRQIARPEGPLEPSVRNEVDRALARAEAWLAAQAAVRAETPPGDILGTNGLAAADVAVRLVSTQRHGGWWITPTNTAPTRLAVEILKELSPAMDAGM